MGSLASSRIRMNSRKLLFNIICFCFLVPVCMALRPTADVKLSKIEAPNAFESSISKLIEEEALVASKQKKSPGPFGAIIFVSAANMLINTVRFDADIPFAWRFPRFMWELSIMTIATLANTSRSPILSLLLAIMLGPTAFFDIFVWAPIFAFFANFETCTGGWFGQARNCYTDNWKGYGRLIVSFQSLYGGLFYLATAIIAFNEFMKDRDRQDAARQYLVLDAFANRKKSEVHQSDV